MGPFCIPTLAQTMSQVQFYWDYINHIWVGLWFGMLYTTTLLVVSTFSTDRSVEHRSEMTMVGTQGAWLVLVSSTRAPD
jgi:hypothetical protein